MGLYALSCVYGIVVNLRFLTRAESSIDYVDSLSGMVHPPNMFVCDFSRQVVASVNIRLPGFCSPFNGYICDPTDKA